MLRHTDLTMDIQVYIGNKITDAWTEIYCTFQAMPHIFLSFSVLSFEGQ